MKRNYFIFLSLLVTGSFISSGCTMGDVFNSDVQKEEEETNFINRFGDIASDQTWNTVVQRKASINLDGSSSETYTVNICTSNPAADSTAQTLYQTTATGGQTITATFDAPNPLKRVFVSRVGTDGQYYACAELSGDSTTFVGSFAPATVSSAKVQTRSSAVVSGDPFTFETVIYPTSEPNGCTEGNNIHSNSTTDEQNISKILLAKDKDSYSFHFWQGIRNIYVTGKNVTLDVDNKTSINQAVIYVLPGASLKFSCSNNINNCIFYVCPGATLNYNYGNLYASGSTNAKIYNKGTLNLLKDLKLGDYGYIYNEGTVTSANKKNISFISGSGNTSYLYNIGGTISTTNITMNSTCNVYNSGAINVSDETKVTQAGCWWINNGHYTSGTFTISANNGTFYNDCQLIVGTANFNDGSFNNMDNSFIYCGDLYMKNFLVNMGSQSLFYVYKSTVAYAQGDNVVQGFKGTGNSYALVKLGYVYIAKHKLTFQLLGNICYAVYKTSLFADSYQDYWSYIWGYDDGDYPEVYYGQNIRGINYYNAEIGDVTDDVCCPTWKVTNVNPKYPTVATNTIAYEDLGATDDFDFNDIVLYIYPDYTTMKMKVDLMAAGGVLPIDVYFDNTLLFSKKDGKMTNTTTRGSVIASKEDIDLPTGFTMSDSKYTSLFKIMVNNTMSTVVINPNVNAGSVPQALVIGGAWDWPTERTHIDDAYPNFDSYVSNSAVNWTNSKKAGKYVQ